MFCGQPFYMYKFCTLRVSYDATRKINAFLRKYKKNTNESDILTINQKQTKEGGSNETDLTGRR